MTLEDNILSSYGGIDRNNLLQVLPVFDTESGIDPLIFSPYYTPETLSHALVETFEYFTVLSLNCQSLSAKFDKIHYVYF